MTPEERQLFITMINLIIATGAPVLKPEAFTKLYNAAEDAGISRMDLLKEIHP